MLTNLIVSIIVAAVTNTTTTDNAHSCPYRPKPIDPGLIYTPAYHAPYEGCDEYVPATEKTEVTTITKVTAFEILWNGKNVTLRDEEVLSRKEQKYSLQSEWKVVSNDFAQRYLYATNTSNFSIDIYTNSALILLSTHTNQLLFSLSSSLSNRTVTITNKVVITNQYKRKLW